MLNVVTFSKTVTPCIIKVISEIVHFRLIAEASSYHLGQETVELRKLEICKCIYYFNILCLYRMQVYACTLLLKKICDTTLLISPLFSNINVILYMDISIYILFLIVCLLVTIGSLSI